MKYEVWIGWKNYTGKVDSREKIAAFISEERAKDYIKKCESEEEIKLVVYELRTKK